MYFLYFDENKISKENPIFHIGGIILNRDNITDFENNMMQIQYNFFGSNILQNSTELHGNHIFHGKGVFKSRSIKDRIQLFNDVVTNIINCKVAIRLVSINAVEHNRKYLYPEPEYRLGLTLILEQFCNFIEINGEHKSCGLVFGDYEKDEITRSIRDFSQFKHYGRTPMAFGRPLGQIKDTIYFTQSHHSRFLQAADMIVYMAGRFGNNHAPSKWHDKELLKIWNKLQSTDFFIKHWP
ncbi:MAG: DUF3800 domain-containing protein [Spirochaetes bacterium]|jgi:hypothetical protein|nr:DUF3800 domain-containing protein [Spirochaetota bacterium]